MFGDSDQAQSQNQQPSHGFLLQFEIAALQKRTNYHIKKYKIIYTYFFIKQAEWYLPILAKRSDMSSDAISRSLRSTFARVRIVFSILYWKSWMTQEAVAYTELTILL